jgi:hypothetical protein
MVNHHLCFLAVFQQLNGNNRLDSRVRVRRFPRPGKDELGGARNLSVLTHDKVFLAVRKPKAEAILSALSKGEIEHLKADVATGGKPSSEILRFGEGAKDGCPRGSIGAPGDNL